MLNNEQKLLCGIAHLGWVVGFPILIPLLILLLYKDDFVNLQAKEALVFQIALTIFITISAILSILLIGIPFLLILIVVSFILPVTAVVKICKGFDYSYPITGKFVREHLYDNYRI